jgi:hypothetical protein
VGSNPTPSEQIYNDTGMIIGIDDSGDYESAPIGLYAAVLIRPKKQSKIKQRFLEWEGKLPNSVKKNGEVKGHLLSNDQLIDFCKVVIRNPFFGIKFLVVGIEIEESSKSALDYQREINLKQIAQGVADYREQGKEFFGVANEYEEMAKWLKKKSYKTLMKIDLLGFALFKALNESIKQSVVRNFSKELADLQFKIDRGFIGKDEHLMYWKDIVRGQMWHFSYHGGGIIHIKQWNSHHPFLRKFYPDPASKAEISIVKSAFRDSINFYDSSESYEIRIADIIASAFFRHFVNGEKLSAVECLRNSNLSGRAPYTLMKLSRTRVQTPNPYADEK